MGESIAHVHALAGRGRLRVVKTDGVQRWVTV